MSQGKLHLPDPHLLANDRAVPYLIPCSAQPVSAYGIVAPMRSERPRVAPPTTYRALARLAASGLVHRAETLNARFALALTSPQGSGIITICDDCGEVGEHPAPEALSAIAGALGATGFHPSRPIVEVHGRCDGCDAKAAS